MSFPKIPGTEKKGNELGGEGVKLEMRLAAS